ncbi:hypothetical protein J4G33_16645 [Actinotalea sp. BY-33]|uniref:Polyketide antibiotic transporter n=1 Tax=Actinotalea soli TaxID=2819234 RepID=A0A939LY77_9CELL|nr:hypothetical protein [Actinotalea soli]MBO1753437.1 hypothetical protein [Actinotalea soli]
MSAVTGAAPARPVAATRGDHGLTGTRRLVRFGLRRDRVRIPAWALGVAGLVGYMGLAIPLAYPDAAARQTRAAIMADPAGALLTGPGYGLADYTFGAMVANELVGMISVAVALMSIFLVVRHTRAEEETGRAELVRAGAVGRYAPLTAALVVAVVANLVVALALVLALSANDLALVDSVAVAVGVATVGLVFTGVAAVTAQLGDHGRSASGTAGAVLGLAYVLRGVGDAQQLGGSASSWASPIGWVQQTRAFVDLRWWPLLLGLGLAVLLIAVAYVLVVRRDVGSGLVASRPGRAGASRGLVRPVGLALRMERVSLVGWGVGLAVFAGLTGSMGQGVVDSFLEQPELAQVFGTSGAQDMLLATLAAFLGFFAMAVAVYAVISVNHLRRDEDEGRTGMVVACGVSRPRWLGSSLAVTAVGAVVLLVVSGLALGLGAGLSTGRAGLAGEFAVAALVHLPLVLCFAGLAALAYAARTGTWGVWLLLVASILVGLYGPILNLPDVVLDAAPFGLVPALPHEALELGPLVAQGAVALALVLLATRAFRRRDLTG